MLFFRGEVDRRVRNDLRGGRKTQTREEVLFAEEEKSIIATSVFVLLTTNPVCVLTFCVGAFCNENESRSIIMESS